MIWNHKCQNNQVKLKKKPWMRGALMVSQDDVVVSISFLECAVEDKAKSMEDL